MKFLFPLFLGICSSFLVLKAETPRQKLIHIIVIYETFPDPNDEDPGCIQIRDRCISPGGGPTDPDPNQDPDPNECEPGDPNCCDAGSPSIQLGSSLLMYSLDMSQSANWISGMTGLIGNRVHYESLLLGHRTGDGIPTIQIEVKVNSGIYIRKQHFIGDTIASHTWPITAVSGHDWFNYHVRTKGIIDCGNSKEEVTGGEMSLRMKPQQPSLRVNDSLSDESYSDLGSPIRKQCGLSTVNLTSSISISIGAQVSLTSMLGISLGDDKIASLVNEYGLTVSINTNLTINNSVMAGIAFDPNKSFDIQLLRIDRYIQFEEYAKDFLYRDYPTGGIATVRSLDWDMEFLNPRSCFKKQ